MKFSTLNLIRYMPALTIACIIGILTACSGPAGPAGPAGSNGTNGNSSCPLCHHDSTDLLAKIRQYDMSQHAIGSAFLQANRTACAGCHTSEGFRETLVTGADTTKAAFANPTTINCRTCHNIHKNFDLTDFNLSYTSPVALRFDNHQTTVDIKKGNLCARCHQARRLSPQIDETKDSIVITSQYWGPHYGPQANVLWGTSAFELTGPYPSSPHKTVVPNGCLTCHMATPVGVGVGGHTFNTARIDEQTGELVTEKSGCLQSGCHSSIGSATNPWDPDGGTKVTQIKAALLALRSKIAAKGWIDTTRAGGDIPFEELKASSSKPLRLSKIEAKALVNYLLVARDNSKGVHNADFVSAVIDQINAVLK